MLPSSSSSSSLFLNHVARKVNGRAQWVPVVDVVEELDHSQRRFGTIGVRLRDAGWLWMDPDQYRLGCEAARA
tara:strand:- start:342 stop:560 length:219 start_codon:yes stop_codon:yes gene_type:complete